MDITTLAANCTPIRIIIITVNLTNLLDILLEAKKTKETADQIQKMGAAIARSCICTRYISRDISWDIYIYIYISRMYGWHCRENCCSRRLPKEQEKKRSSSFQTVSLWLLPLTVCVSPYSGDGTPFEK